MAYDEALAARVRDELAGEPGMTEKRMFGGLAFLLDRHMAVAVSGAGGLMVRVPPDRTEELLGEPGAEPMEMKGRAMAGWLRVDVAALGDDAVLAGWVAVGRDFVATLPPKCLTAATRSGPDRRYPAGSAATASTSTSWSGNPSAATPSNVLGASWSPNAARTTCQAATRSSRRDEAT